MQSKNKKAMTVAERDHVTRIKGMDCAVCGASGPSEAHEIEQGFWHLAVPLCQDCHRGSHNGLHGQKRIWSVLKKSELSVLNDTIARVVHGLV